MSKLPGKANTVQMRPGDELVIMRRRFEEVEDAETHEKAITHQDVLIAGVRCPEDLEITGGEISGEFDEDQKFILVRLRCRNVAS